MEPVPERLGYATAYSLAEMELAIAEAKLNEASKSSNDDHSVQSSMSTSTTYSAFLESLTPSEAFGFISFVRQVQGSNPNAIENEEEIAGTNVTMHQLMKQRRKSQKKKPCLLSIFSVPLQAIRGAVKSSKKPGNKSFSRRNEATQGDNSSSEF